MVMAGELPIPAVREEPDCLGSSWYLPRKIIEVYSPSRKDGIDLKKEAQLRNLYCSFLQDVGKKLKLPQVTIAVAMMICHRFYLRQSHARNEWQTIATASMFLASKVEETPRMLMDVVVVAYETMYRRDPLSAQRIKDKDVSEKQKDLILTAERLVLSTINFDFNIQLPYKPLVAAFKKFKIANDMCKLAWNFVNDWLRTTLCLQYKPHYIAAGSLYIAAKYCLVKLPSESGMVWWHDFDVTPRQLEEVIKQMQVFLGQNKTMTPFPLGKVSKVPAAAGAGAGSAKEESSSPESCVLDASGATTTTNHPINEGPGQVNPTSSVIHHDPGALDLSSNGICIIGNGSSHCQTSDCAEATASDHPINEGPGQVNPASSAINHDTGAQDLSTNDIRVIGDGDLQCQTSDCGSTHSTVEDSGRVDEGANEARIKANCGAGSDIFSVSKGLSGLEKDRIRSKLKRKRWDRATSVNKAEAADDAIDDDAWIERELEKGIVIGVEHGEKKQRQF